MPSTLRLPLSAQQQQWVAAACAEINEVRLRQLITEMVAIPSPTGEERALAEYLTPLWLSMPELNIPIVPLVQNCNAPPLPILKRSYTVGKGLGEAIRRGQAGRVVVMGTGGLSHWVGSPAFQSFMNEPAGTRLERQKDYPLTLTDTGVNEDFDRAFIDLICRGKAQQFRCEWHTDRLCAAGGNGAQELRIWLLIAGVVQDQPGRFLGYEPVKEWLTATAVAQFRHSLH